MNVTVHGAALRQYAPRGRPEEAVGGERSLPQAGAPLSADTLTPTDTTRRRRSRRSVLCTGTQQQQRIVPSAASHPSSSSSIRSDPHPSMTTPALPKTKTLTQQKLSFASAVVGAPRPANRAAFQSESGQAPAESGQAPAESRERPAAVAEEVSYQSDPDDNRHYTGDSIDRKRHRCDGDGSEVEDVSTPPTVAEVCVGSPISPYRPLSISAEQRRSKEIELRRSGKLTEESLDSLGVINSSLDWPLPRGGVSSSRGGSASPLTCNDFVEPGVLHYHRGTLSQFCATPGLPPTAKDSCETFSCTVVAVMACIGVHDHLGPLFNGTSVNYFTYAAAWLHEISRPLWSTDSKRRPTADDVMHHARLAAAFPMLRVASRDFIPLFYYNAMKTAALIQELLIARDEEPTTAEGGSRRRGYVIVAGDMTVGVVALEHWSQERGTFAWTLMLADSHGELPWSGGNATLNTVIFSHEESPPPSPRPLLPRSVGVAQFTRILFSLLEHCRERCNPNHTQYMTWVPVAVDCRASSGCASASSPPFLTPKEAVDALHNTCIRGLLRDYAACREAFESAARPAATHYTHWFEVDDRGGGPAAPKPCWVPM